MTTATEHLVRAIKEVAETPSSMRKLARAASTRPNIEGEWVHEIDGTDALEEVHVAREVPIGNRQRADLRIDGTFVEFKSTMARYARPDYLWIASSPTKDSAEGWLGPDLTRMSTRNGLFVLLVSTTAANTEDTASQETERERAITVYADWLLEYGEALKAGAEVLRVSAGQGVYAGVRATHDALIVSSTFSTVPG